MIFFMGLNLLNNLIGANVPNKQHVGGRLGIDIDRNIPTTFKDKVKGLQNLPNQASDQDVVKARKSAVVAEETVYRIKKISEHKIREAEAWLEAHETLLNHRKGLISVGQKAAFKDAGYLKNLMHFDLLQKEAEVEVTAAHAVAQGTVNTIWE